MPQWAKGCDLAIPAAALVGNGFLAPDAAASPADAARESRTEEAKEAAEAAAAEATLLAALRALAAANGTGLSGATGPSDGGSGGGSDGHALRSAMAAAAARLPWLQVSCLSYSALLFCRSHSASLPWLQCAAGEHFREQERRLSRRRNAAAPPPPPSPLLSGAAATPQGVGDGGGALGVSRRALGRAVRARGWGQEAGLVLSTGAATTEGQGGGAKSR